MALLRALSRGVNDVSELTGVTAADAEGGCRLLQGSSSPLPSTRRSKASLPGDFQILKTEVIKHRKEI